ncbi:unnamed protein product [Eretmochelys imbricata]
MELRFLLLLLLLLLCISGFQEQEFDAVESRMEGQRLVVKCLYSSMDYSATLKTWCRLRDEECYPLVSTSYPSSRRHPTKFTFGRATIEDDTHNGIVTITMEKLQVQDSGAYWCARFEPPNILYRLTAIKLDVSKATSTSDVPVTSTTGHTSLIFSAGVNPADSSFLSERTVIIVSVVLGVLFILVLLGVVILCTRQSRQLKTRGDGQAEGIYEESKDATVSQGFSNMNDPKDDKQEMAQDLKYVTLVFKSRPSPPESVYANITPSQALETPHTRFPTEPVGYASISLKPLASGAKS